MGMLVIVAVLAVIGIALLQRQKKKTKVTPSRPVGLDGSGTTRPADDTTTILPTTDN